jgi:hypothetical protein
LMCAAYSAPTRCWAVHGAAAPGIRRAGAGPRGSAPSPRRALGAPSAPRPPAGAEEMRRPSGRHGSASRRPADLRISPEARAEPAAGHRRRSGPCHRS